MSFRTDLAVEAIENMDQAADHQQVRQTERTLEGFSVNEVEIRTDHAAREIGKPRGRYLTLELDALIRREDVYKRQPLTEYCISTSTSRSRYSVSWYMPTAQHGPSGCSPSAAVSFISVCHSRPS